MKFKLGRVFQTTSMSDAISSSADFAIFVSQSLQRYVRCDWGDLCDEDAELNADALKSGDRLFAAYKYKDGRKVYIITEADRSATTILFPEEY